MSNFWKTKSIEKIIKSSEEPDGSLKKVLTGKSLIALGIGAIVGAGIFSLTGIGAGNYSGPAITLSFILAAIAISLVAMCYTEFASMLPISGSAYSYAYATLGEFMAWMIGWDLVLEYSLAAAFVSCGWSQYLTYFLNDIGLHIPSQLTTATLDGGILNLPAVLIVCIVSILLVRGITESIKVNNILVFIKLAIIITFIVIGWMYIKPENYHPYIPDHDPVTNRYGWSGMIQGAALVFVAFIGFDAISTAAQEVKNPQKNIPIGIFGSLLICTALYVAFSYVMTGLLHYTQFVDNASPLVSAFKVTGYTFINTLMNVAIIIGLTSVILVVLFGQSRIFYTMSNDGLLPKFFGEVHKKHKTPWKSNIFFMFFVSFLSGVVPLKILANLVSLGTLIAFIIVCISVIILRKKMPNLKRPFKTPFSPIIPALGAIICLALALSLNWETWVLAAVWLIIGVLVYLFYGQKNSKMNN